MRRDPGAMANKFGGGGGRIQGIGSNESSKVVIVPVLEYSYEYENCCLESS
jgi:hypothetical protein